MSVLIALAICAYTAVTVVLFLSFSRPPGDDRRVMQTLAGLKCSICWNVMACPVTVTGCRHSFCAVCLLAWYLKNMYGCCDNWHFPVQCPICGEEMATPLSAGDETNCPIVYDRMADEILIALISLVSPMPNVQEVVDIPYWRYYAESGRVGVRNLLSNWRTLHRSRFIAARGELDIIIVFDSTCTRMQTD